VGFDPQIPTGKFRVALGTIFLVMASFATLGIICGFDGMDVDPVAAVTLRLIVAAEIFHSQVIPRTTA
jgi:hypothetical protein